MAFNLFVTPTFGQLIRIKNGVLTSIASAALLIGTPAQAGISLVCGQGDQTLGSIEISDRNEVKKNTFCWGGKDSSLQKKGNWRVLECGDDGQQTVVIMASQTEIKSSPCVLQGPEKKVDWKNSIDLIEAFTFRNISPGYPFADGRAIYMNCCSQPE
jgi:hypothetical protein